MLIKQINIDEIGFKFADSGMQFSGYASVFNGVDSYGDMIQKGAYEETLKNRQRPIRMRWNHYGEVIGKWTTLKEDNKGLYVEGELTPNHSKAMDVYASMKHGAVDGMSIGYRVVSSEKLENGVNLLKQIDLVEISVVEEPADLGAKIGDVKAMIDQFTTLKDYENFLRESGFSKDAATLFVGRMKSLCRSESDAEMREKQALKDIFARHI